MRFGLAWKIKTDNCDVAGGTQDVLTLYHPKCHGTCLFLPGNRPLQT